MKVLCFILFEDKYWRKLIFEFIAIKKESREVWSIKWWFEKESKSREVCMISLNIINGIVYGIWINYIICMKDKVIN